MRGSLRKTFIFFRKSKIFQLFLILCTFRSKIYPRKFIQFFARDSPCYGLWPEATRLWITSLTKKFYLWEKNITLLSTFLTHLKKSWDMSNIFGFLCSFPSILWKKNPKKPLELRLRSPRNHNLCKWNCEKSIEFQAMK